MIMSCLIGLLVKYLLTDRGLTGPDYSLRIEITTVIRLVLAERETAISASGAQSEGHLSRAFLNSTGCLKLSILAGSSLLGAKINK